jgi:tRNA-dihydrouridine synthase A
VELAQAAEIGAGYGYDEINLNVGCPSDRVQSGCFGAILMERPGLVAECVAAMIGASPVEVTVKCRIGVDEQVPEEVLPEFLETISEAGVRRVAIHARKAWLQGLSPKENRDVPPLDYPLVHRMKAEFPHLHVSINGGIASLEEARAHLDAGMDGVMIGRAAYHDPAGILGRADHEIFDDPAPGAARKRPCAPCCPISRITCRAAAAQPDHAPHAGAVRGPAGGAGMEADAVGRRASRRRGAGPGGTRARRGHATRRVTDRGLSSALSLR